MLRLPPRSTLFPTRRSSDLNQGVRPDLNPRQGERNPAQGGDLPAAQQAVQLPLWRRDVQFAPRRDRKSTRLNSSHGYISYAVFCLKKKTTPAYLQLEHAIRP